MLMREICSRFVYFIVCVYINLFIVCLPNTSHCGPTPPLHQLQLIDFIQENRDQDEIGLRFSGLSLYLEV